MCSECQKALFVYVTQSMLSSLSAIYMLYSSHHRHQKNPVTFTIPCIILICSLLLLFGVFLLRKLRLLITTTTIYIPSSSWSPDLRTSWLKHFQEDAEEKKIEWRSTRWREYESHIKSSGWLSTYSSLK